MIYSRDIAKVCAVCVNAHKGDGGMYCEVKKQTVPEVGEACKKFSYDILKRTVRRARRIKTDFNPEDFTF